MRLFLWICTHNKRSFKLLLYAILSTISIIRPPLHIAHAMCAIALLEKLLQKCTFYRFFTADSRMASFGTNSYVALKLG